MECSGSASPGAEGDDSCIGGPSRKRRRTRYLGFPSDQRGILQQYEKMESSTRKALMDISEKLTVIPNNSSGISYLRTRLQDLTKKPSLEPVYIGLFGSTGAGKSSLLNAIINEKMFLPVSGESTCTSCLVQVSSGVSDICEAKIHLLSDEEWEEELRNLKELIVKNETRSGEEEVDEYGIVQEAILKLNALYGLEAENKSVDELLSIKIFNDKTIVLKGSSANDLSEQMDLYIRNQSELSENNERELWPLVNHVEVTLAVSELLPRGVVLMDIPGTGDFNSIRDLMWKESINKCSAIWIIGDVQRIKGGKDNEVLLREGIKALQKGTCSEIALVITKSENMNLEVYLRERSQKKQQPNVEAPKDMYQAILERNKTLKQSKERSLRERLKKNLPSDAEVLDSSELVYTVSAEEYWKKEHLTEEETEIPKLRQKIRSIYLKEKKKMVSDYITQAFGIVSLAEHFEFQVEHDIIKDFCHDTLKSYLEVKIQCLEKDADKCFNQIKGPLTEGVKNAKSSYKRILDDLLFKKKVNQGFHRTLKAICLKNGVFASRVYLRIDLNEAISQPVYDKIGSVFQRILRTGKDTRSSLMTYLDEIETAFKAEILKVAKKLEADKQNGKYQFLSTETQVIFSNLKRTILKRKVVIFESFPVSVQNDLKPVYEEAAKIKGKNSCEKMKNILREGFEKEVIGGMFERAKDQMLQEMNKLKKDILVGLKDNIVKMLELALSQREALPCSLPDLRKEYNYIKAMYHQLKNTP
ncbi:nuclear GTPase SLIP-GC-like [Tachyglossus aculeatus]|uniref:nuclear GTPase SLIP-GC-like n=1 Tax=Tachyglossus aculeatus TaxID=9261 RepID=UPI0018F4F739|nr:nuclear GTPase SLIP-GC-like [Tachyglossus aculeatus]XP_038607302.1 nuclear GTPase SLIP-GC-like [Tachyglossus aculeatus]